MTRTISIISGVSFIYAAALAVLAIVVMNWPTEDPWGKP